MGIDSYMTPRLLKIAELVKNCDTIADVGTDHAYIPIYLVLHGLAKSAIAMDINEGPLLRANENIEKFKLDEKIKTRLSDGLLNLKNNEADTVIIAGMGGILINRILNNDKERLSSVKNYILQPMTAVDETRRYLENNGFLIVDEKLAKEDDKIYNVILATQGKMQIKNEVNYYVGECLIKNKDEFLEEFLDGKIYELKKAISSMQNAENDEIKGKLLHFKFLLSEYENIKKECAKW